MMQAFSGKTVLISGANGFLPGTLALRLLDAGARVIALCRDKARAEKRFAAVLENPDLRLMIQDVCAPISCGEKIDYAIHGASPAGIQSRHEFPVDTFNANVLGCENLLNLKPSRFMLISSVDVYGKLVGNERLVETDNGYLDILNARNAYAAGKRAAETVCALYAAQHRADTVIARPFQVYGPGMVIGDGRLHGDFVHQIKASGKIVLKSDGTAVRSFMYVDDAVDAMLTVLCHGITANAYNIVDESCEASVLELAELYASETGVPVEFDYEQRGKIEVTEALPRVLGSSDKLRGLGWKPGLGLVEGVRRTIEHYFR